MVQIFMIHVGGERKKPPGGVRRIWSRCGEELQSSVYFAIPDMADIVRCDLTCVGHLFEMRKFLGVEWDYQGAIPALATLNRFVMIIVPVHTLALIRRCS